MSPAEDVAQNPPKHEYGENRPCEERAVHKRKEAWQASAEKLGYGIDGDNGQKQHQHRIEAPRPGKVAAQERMNGTLATASGTLIARERPKRAFRKEMRR